LVKIFSFWLVGCGLLAQTGGRFEDAKRMALAYIGSEQYDKAAGKLEEVWEQDQSDPTVGENLALSYLNTEDRHAIPTLQKQAFAIMDLLAARHERVSFIVHHSHERLAWLQGRQWHQYCSGRLSISEKSIVFLAETSTDAAKHAFEIPVSNVNNSTFESDEDSDGVFHVKSPKGGYVMSVRNRNREEAKFLVALVRRREASRLE
jgi:hypothetical protein